MIFHYLKIFTRLFLQKKVFTLINILGLAVALACCLVIAVFVRNEFSFDKFFANSANLYRVSLVRTLATGEVVKQATTYLPVATALADNFPAVTGTARLSPRGTVLLSGGDAIFEEEFKLVDPAFFQLFDFHWLEGDSSSALAGATDVIVSSSFANKYFGANSALGQSVLTADGLTLRVTGVIEDLPSNTHLSGTVFASNAIREALGRGIEPGQEWRQTAAYTYVALRSDTDVAQFRQQLDSFARANIPQTANAPITLTLDAITDIHLNFSLGDWSPAGKPAGNKVTIAVFSAVGLGLLLVACANFVNLSTALSMQRFREVGLRLTMGARRSQLLVQFLGESVLLVLVAMLLALVFAELSLPWVQLLLERDLAFNDLSAALPLPMVVGAGVLLGVLAGWYPALLMSGYAPVAALKDPSRLHVRGIALKNVLVVLQFSIAVSILVAAAVIYLQMRFVSKLDAGYVSDNLMVIALDSDLGSYSRRQLLKERLLQGTAITAATFTEATPDRIRGTADVNAEGSDAQHKLAWYLVDFDFFAVYDIALLQGRLPNADITSARVRTTPQAAEPVGSNVLLSESGARAFGWSAAEALGKRLARDGAWFQVIGVVEDTIETAYDPAKPTIYAIPDDMSSLRFLAVKFASNDVAATVAFIERTWKELNPGEPLTSIFQSELVEARYHDDNKRQRFAFLFAAIAIAICCMGLFGLANFSAQRRIKEIGVRKVMGASVWSIVLLLTNDFSKLVLLSNLIAWPIAYYAMNRWLENFAYRIDLTPLIFIGSGLIALCIAWVTVGGTAAKAASQKPVLALRYE
jgi:putative ABC transport system permease protein